MVRSTAFTRTYLTFAFDSSICPPPPGLPPRRDRTGHARRGVRNVAGRGGGRCRARRRPGVAVAELLKGLVPVSIGVFLIFRLILLRRNA